MARKYRDVPQITHPLPHHPPIDEQQRAVRWSEWVVERERHVRIQELFHVELKCRDEETHTRTSTRKAVGQIAHLPCGNIEAGEVPPAALAEETALVEHATRFVGIAGGRFKRRRYVEMCPLTLYNPRSCPGPSSRRSSPCRAQTRAHHADSLMYRHYLDGI